MRFGMRTQVGAHTHTHQGLGHMQSSHRFRPCQRMMAKDPESHWRTLPQVQLRNFIQSAECLIWIFLGPLWLMDAGARAPIEVCLLEIRCDLLILVTWNLRPGEIPEVAM